MERLAQHPLRRASPHPLVRIIAPNTQQAPTSRPTRSSPSSWYVGAEIPRPPLRGDRARATRREAAVPSSRARAAHNQKRNQTKQKKPTTQNLSSRRSRCARATPSSSTRPSCTSASWAASACPTCAGTALRATTTSWWSTCWAPRWRTCSTFATGGSASRPC